MIIVKLPLAKNLLRDRPEISRRHVAETPIDESLLRRLATATLLTARCNAVLIAGTGIGNSPLSTAIARSCFRSGARGRFNIAVITIGYSISGATRFFRVSSLRLISSSASSLPLSYSSLKR